MEYQATPVSLLYRRQTSGWGWGMVVGTQDLDFSASLDICCRTRCVLQCNWPLLFRVRFQPSFIPAPSLLTLLTPLPPLPLHPYSSPSLAPSIFTFLTPLPPLPPSPAFFPSLDFLSMPTMLPHAPPPSSPRSPLLVILTAVKINLILFPLV